MGSLIGIYIAAGKTETPKSVEQANVVVGRGVEGDRYFAEHGTFSKSGDPSNEVTLIEQEAIEALARDYSTAILPEESRRNLLTRGTALNHLVGKDFRIGEATLHGIRLCEPCGHLEKLTAKAVEAGLKHRGGLRARVVVGGAIRVGDEIRAQH
jgi:MOSC domain-containing protein YiiM